MEISTRSLSGFESGNMAPADATVRELAKHLEFPYAFFFCDSLDVPNPDTVSFRSASTMTASQRDTAISEGALAIAVNTWLEQHFELPHADLPDLAGHAPEDAAEILRIEWGLRDKPIKNMLHLAESKGVRVFSLIQECQAVDAFSLWRGGTPFIFLNMTKSGERGRFDVAHELAHLVLHKNGRPQGRQAESEADAFASAFLMPRLSVMSSVVRPPTVDQLIRLKPRWKVSVAALTHRLHDLRVMSDWHYRSTCVEIARRRYRKQEPAGIPREQSQMLAKVLQSLREQGISLGSVAASLHLAPP